jgi:hypothetical protein
MYATALASIEAEGPLGLQGGIGAEAEAYSAKLFEAFENLHTYSQDKFADPVLREWACYLTRDGSPHPQYPDKGTWIKVAAHVLDHLHPARACCMRWQLHCMRWYLHFGLAVYRCCHVA